MNVTGNNYILLFVQTLAEQIKPQFKESHNKDISQHVKNETLCEITAVKV